MKVSFELVGETPMLMHADDVEAADSLTEWRQDPANKNLSKPGDDRSPAWTWMTYLYTDGSHVALPSENLMVCLRNAGTRMILKRNKTFKELSQSGLVIPSEFCDLYVSKKQIAVEPINALRDKTFKQQADAVEELGFRLYVKRARVGMTKHVRVRARFDEWTVRGEVEVVAKEITFDHLKQLFDLAGRVGLCDWRPGCRTPGPWGMFEAKLRK